MSSSVGVLASFEPEPVWSLVASKKLGFNDAEILENYPTLRQQDLDNAWNYYLIHQAEIELEVLENEEANSC